MKLTHDWYKMDYEAWDEGTDGLDLEQEGAYLRLCHQMYRRGGPIPNEVRLHVRIFRVHQNTARALVRRLLELGKLHLNDDGELINDKVMSVLIARQTQSQAAATNGRKGGRPRSDTPPTPSRHPADTPARLTHHVVNGAASSAHDPPKRLKNNEAQKPFGFIDESEPKAIREEKRREESLTGANAHSASRETQPAPPTATAELFLRGKEILGKSAGGLIAQLLTKKDGNVGLARAALELAAEAENPREYIGRVIKPRSPLDDYPDAL